MKKEVNTHEAKTQLSRLLKRVALGEEIIIASRGKPVAQLVPLHTKKSQRKLGMYEGKFTVPEDFDEPLQEILDAFEGKLPKDDKKRKKA